MKTRVIASVAVVLVAVAMAWSQGPEQARQQPPWTLVASGKGRPVSLNPPAKSLGTIAYDTGGISGYTPNYVGRSLWGNLFDSNQGVNPLAPGTISSIFWCQGVPGLSPVRSPYLAFVVVAPNVNPTAGTFAALQGIPYPAMTSNGCFSLTGLSINVGPAFIAGLSNATSLGSGLYAGMAWDANTLGGQGFHGVRAGLAAGPPWGFAPITAPPISFPQPRNAVVRVSGNIVVPIELLDFHVE